MAGRGGHTLRKMLADLMARADSQPIELGRGLILRCKHGPNPGWYKIRLQRENVMPSDVEVKVILRTLADLHPIVEHTRQDDPDHNFIDLWVQFDRLVF